MTQVICEITTDEVNVDVVVEPQADTIVEVDPQADARVEVANRAGGMEQVFHDNTLIGNGNSIDLGVNTDLIATKEYVDEKVALSIDTYTKDQIDGKFTVANAQIGANAEAIQKTREDYIEADSEIHQILNNHAGELTTLHNDVDNLGDQVSGIEEKIPETASAENPLVTRSEISSVYKFKGSVATYNDLPTGATVGDVYNVTDTGANYAWDGSAWDKLSETVDLSSYATTAYVNAREQDIRDDYMQADSDLQTQINGQATAIAGNTDDITEINGKISSSASSTNKLISASELTAESQDIRSDYMAADSELQTQINGLSSAVATNQSNISTLRTDVDDLENQATANHNDITAHIADTNNPHSVTAAQTGALPNTTKYGATLSLTIDSTTYVVTAQLKDQDGNNLGTAQTIDLPLESVVVSGSYDSATKEVVLTLQGGSTIRFSVADLVSGLQTEITALNMLSADLVDDTNTTHKFVTTTEKSTWSGKQDAISDLATIRSNAQAGKAVSDTIATYGDIVTHDVAEFATAAQGVKADTALQTGNNVSELVNDAGFITNAVNNLQNYTLTSDLATVATSGSYNDLSNKPTIPAAQVNSDWNANSGVAQILNKPTLATVATSGSYNDLSNKPTIPTVNNATLTIQKNGTTVQTFTANQSTNATANISVPTKTSDITNDSGFITGSALAPYALSADLATVATSGSYNDLSNKPTIPTVNNPTITITQGGVTKGSFALNQATAETIALDAGGGSGLPDQTGHAGEFLTTDGTDASWSENFKIAQYSLFVGNKQSYDSLYQTIIGIGAVTDMSAYGATAIGYNSYATKTYTLAIGFKAKATATCAIQLGSDGRSLGGYTNSDANTFKVGNKNGNFEMMSADGTIPADRIGNLDFGTIN